ncbi:MAG: hypothetical protein LUD72_04750 [Bacteroidales bacterium]|nr:hypothetical protein [Bacteroidales bacterium]
MIKFGNILTESETFTTEDFLNVCHTREELDESLPTLVIGLELARRTIDGFDIRTKDYPEQNLCWTFKRVERQADFREDLENFTKRCILSLMDGIGYYYANVMTMSYSTARRFVSYLRNDEPKDIYIDRNRFAFIYAPERAEIYGLSLTTCEYLGIPKNKVKERLFANPFNARIREFSNIPNTVRRTVLETLPQCLVVNHAFN